MKRLCNLGCVVVVCVLGSCQKPPDLVDSLPKHTFLTLDELDENVRVSFMGPDERHGQAITDDARTDESLFVLLEPRAVRGERALGKLVDGGFAGRKPSDCKQACAEQLTFRDQGLWVEGEVCRNGPVAAFSTFDLPPVSSNPPTVYRTSGISIPGQFDLLDQVTCYNAYIFHQGVTICKQLCHGCNQFECTFSSTGLTLHTEMPAGNPSVREPLADCDLSDPDNCGIETPGDPPGQPPPA